MDFNFLLPKANAAEVCEAVRRWHLAEGYELQNQRGLFPCDMVKGEDAVFVISNEEWCVVVPSHRTEEGSCMLRRAFVDFPAVILLSRQAQGWGYELQERGAVTATFRSKPRSARSDRAQASARHARMEAVCAMIGLASRIRKTEKVRSLFARKGRAAFVEALGVPVGMLCFFEVEQANAGILEPRSVCNWQFQMLTFRKRPALTSPLAQMESASSDPAVRAGVNRIRTQSRRAAWYKRLLAPFGLVLMLVIFMALPFIFIFAWLSTLGPIRRVLFGQASRDNDKFLQELKSLEPKRIVLSGETLRNLRHGCSIRVPMPANACGELPPARLRKGPQIVDPVFDVQLGEHTLKCVAYPPDLTVTVDRMENLERYTVNIANGVAEFKKRLIGHARKKFYSYEWTIKAVRAVYQFGCFSRTELSPSWMKTAEEIVSSFEAESAV